MGRTLRNVSILGLRGKYSNYVSRGSGESRRKDIVRFVHFSDHSVVSGWGEEEPPQLDM